MTSIRTGVTTKSYVMAKLGTWVGEEVLIADLVASPFIGSVLRPRYPWAYGFDKYVNYDKANKSLRLKPNTTHLTMVFVKELDLNNKSYVVDFIIDVDDYKDGEDNAFEFGIFPFYTHYETDWAEAFRAAHENCITVSQHTTIQECKIYTARDVVQTKKIYVLAKLPYSKYLLRRTMYVRLFITKSKFKVIIPGFLNKQYNLDNLRWCIGYNPLLMFRSGGSSTTIRTNYHNITKYEIDVVDYSGSLPVYPVCFGMVSLTSYENNIEATRKSRQWKTKATGGTVNKHEGSTDVLSSFTLDVTSMSLDDAEHTHYLYNKATGTSEFLEIPDASLLTEYNNTLVNSITKYEKPQVRTSLTTDSDWMFKATGAYDFSRIRNINSLVSFENTLTIYNDWGFKPNANAYGYALECLFNNTALVEHENDITDCGNLGDLPWYDKVSGGIVTITYG